MGEPGGSLEVDAALLLAKASELEVAAFSYQPPFEVPGPDGTPTIASRAAAALSANAQDILNCIGAAENERERLVASLRAAANAYEEASRSATAAIDGGHANVEPVAVDTSGLPPSREVLLRSGWQQDRPEYGHTDVDVNAGQLEEKRLQGLQDFQDGWRRFLGSIDGQSAAFTRPRGWHSPAADACATAIDAHREWLELDLRPACDTLVAQARALLNAHLGAASDHPSKSTAEALLSNISASSGRARAEYIAQYQELQQLSDSMMLTYARAAQVLATRIEPPPSGGPVMPPVPRKAYGNAGESATASGASGAGGGGRQAEAVLPSAPHPPLGDGQLSGAAGEQPGGEPSARPGADPPASGPSTAGPGTGAGTSGSATPRSSGPSTELPRADEAGLHPAAANAGAGGGPGGGTAGVPMQPTVGAVATAPGPTSAAPGGVSPAGQPAVANVGGGAPMAGGQGRSPGTEKRRTPALAPDEELYTEDRAWTEGYIGRPRRTPKSSSTQRRDDEPHGTGDRASGDSQ